MYNVYVFTTSKLEIPNAKKLTYEETDKMITSKEFTLFASITRPLGANFIDDEFAKIRKRAIQFLVPAFLNVQLVQWFTDAMYEKHDLEIVFDKSLQDYLSN